MIIGNPAERLAIGGDRPAVETLTACAVSDLSMKPSWTLRQLLALLRGLAIMVALFWVLILFQLGPAFFRGGFTALRDQIVRVATAGVPPEHWDIAITRMYEALGAIAIVGLFLYKAQRYLGRKLSSQRESWDRP